ncbi:RagB/SusD family nutrient uptake outer membrane protein [Sphingobacterium sp. SRCM116780]|uniref:RagB/SusD family nutrient uptake outer membrane protein n=1 Tax=Sphingobacterium sp. SRCM116780 TaxID=2907623 RepID=UPI001F389F3F|nr:RagB/SusD family nutrient uptake outer membrane protein [Sphingobacterium sp. SRCM116780]UIR54895.1 RagB/SusD family nutrient uptake outer membrane protein [Sphingobacterium sp. SRCM116780]
MKRIVYILIATISFTSIGCKKFLEEKSLDEVKPTTAKDLSSLMAGEAYPYQTNLSPILNLITDDVSANGGQDQLNYQDVMKKGRPVFSWSKQMFEELLLPTGFSNTAYINSWEVIYQKIAGCNVALEYADQVSGTDAEKANMKGEALALRAYYYFLLVNMFGQPYNTAGLDPKDNLGVPLKLEMAVKDELFKRNSVAEVYAQIEKDLQDAIGYFSAYPVEKGVYKMNETAVYTLLSRVSLYEEKWDQAILYANKALAKKSILSQLSTFNAVDYYLFNVNTNTNNLNRIYDPAVSREIIWAYVPLSGGENEIFRSSLIPGYNAVRNPPYRVSADLLKLYDSQGDSQNEIYIGDLRPRIYFKYSPVILSFIPPNTVIRDYKPFDGGMGGAGFRVAELYLNRAEANVRKYMQTGDDAQRIAALKDINTLRASRYDTRKPYVAIDITDKEQLLSFYKDERRREFPFDGHRWFDLRRYGMPAITHYYEEQVGAGETFTLSDKDSRYTLPIPQAVLDRNGLIIPNP